MHWVQRSGYRIPYTICPIRYGVSCTLNRMPYILFLIACAIFHIPCTLNSVPLTLGQVLYPHDSDEMRASGRRDEDILHLLAKVKSVLPSLKSFLTKVKYVLLCQSQVCSPIPKSEPIQVSCPYTLNPGRAGDVKRFRGGLVFKADRLVYHSTLGLRAMNRERVGGETRTSSTSSPKSSLYHHSLSKVNSVLPSFKSSPTQVECVLLFLKSSLSKVKSVDPL